MTSKLIHSTTLFQDGEFHSDAWVLLAENKTTVGSGADWSSLLADEVVDGSGQILHAGFFDTHCHGGGGHAANRGLNEIRSLLDYNQKHQVSRNLISLVSASVPEMLDIAESARELTADSRFVGLHFEGPFLSEAQCGAQNPSSLKSPTTQELEAIIATRTVRSMTIAPELFSQAQLSLLASSGIQLCFGHSGSDYEQAKDLFESFPGSVMTHTFNAMLPIHHRAPGPVPAAIETETFMELIADGVHVAPAVAKLIPTERLVLVTDAIEAAGHPDGTYTLGGLSITVDRGIARTNEGNLAGSTLAMDIAVQNYSAWSGDPLSAMRAATSNPERAYSVAPVEVSLENHYLLTL